MSKFYYTFDKNGMVVFDVTKIVFMELDDDEVFDQLMKVHETAVNTK
jgi:hypothetical protein